MNLLQLEDKNAKEIVFFVLDLNDLEKEIYSSLLDKRLTVKDLVEETGRTRSVVQRSLQELMDKDLVVRKGVTDRTVYYVYESVPFDEVKKTVKKILRKWHESVQAKLD